MLKQLIHKTRPSRLKSTGSQRNMLGQDLAGKHLIKALKIEITAFTWLSSLFFIEMLLS